MQSVTFNAGDTIISEGDAGNTAFFIVKGSVEVIVGQGSKARPVATLKAGEVFGEMCLIEPGPRSATVKASAEVECLTTSYEEFLTMVERDPERAIEFMKTLVRRLRQMNELMASMDPRKRGLREMFSDWRKSHEPSNRATGDASEDWVMPVW